MGTSQRKPREVKSKLDEFIPIIIEKVDLYGSTAKSVYDFISDKGYKGGYGIVNTFVQKHKHTEQTKATVRFETSPGLQAQVDWKERLKLTNRDGEILEVNIFLMVLGYSRKKFLKVTTDRNQETLFECLIDAFEHFEGVPKEILFDNMKTVVDRSKSSFRNSVINQKFNYFALDSGFKVITCRPYRPQTKGKVEALAKFTNRLNVFNGEFDTYEDLVHIVKDLNKKMDNEVSQATSETPNARFENEKKYLSTLPNICILSSYIKPEKQYKATKESMITYKGKKYSVPISFIGSTLEVIENNNLLKIYKSNELVVVHPLSEKMLNYKRDHLNEILKSDVFRDYDDDSIKSFIEKNMEQMDWFITN